MGGHPSTEEGPARRAVSGGCTAKSVGLALTVAAVTGTALAPAAASAATASPVMRAAHAVGAARAGSDPGTTVTFAVTSGLLTMTVPTAASLGSGAPGQHDHRSAGNGHGDRQPGPAQRLLDGDRGLERLDHRHRHPGRDHPGRRCHLRSRRGHDLRDDQCHAVHHHAVQFAAAPVVAGTAGTGNNTASWDPTIAVAVPAAAVGGALHARRSLSRCPSPRSPTDRPGADAEHDQEGRSCAACSGQLAAGAGRRDPDPGGQRPRGGRTRPDQACSVRRAARRRPGLRGAQPARPALHHRLPSAGTVIHRRITVLNQESRTAHFTVYPDTAGSPTESSSATPGQPRSELTSWVSVQHPVPHPSPDAAVMDMITIRVPRRPTRGEHYGVIWVQQVAHVLRSATALPSKRWAGSASASTWPSAVAAHRRPSSPSPPSPGTGQPEGQPSSLLSRATPAGWPSTWMAPRG